MLHVAPAWRARSRGRQRRRRCRPPPAWPTGAHAPPCSGPPRQGGERSARRPPAAHKSIPCAYAKQRLNCPDGERCQFAHSLYEVRGGAPQLPQAWARHSPLPRAAAANAAAPPTRPPARPPARPPMRASAVLAAPRPLPHRGLPVRAGLQAPVLLLRAVRGARAHVPPLPAQSRAPSGLVVCSSDAGLPRARPPAPTPAPRNPRPPARRSSCAQRTCRCRRRSCAGRRARRCSLGATGTGPSALLSFVAGRQRKDSHADHFCSEPARQRGLWPLDRSQVAAREVPSAVAAVRRAVRSLRRAPPGTTPVALAAARGAAPRLFAQRARRRRGGTHASAPARPAGMPSSRATIAACESGAPMSVTTAAARGKMGVQLMSVILVTRISPGWNWSLSSGPVITRASPSTQPADPAAPLMVSDVWVENEVCWS